MLSNLLVSLFIICFTHWKVHIRKAELTTSWTPALTIVPTLEYHFVLGTVPNARNKEINKMTKVTAS